MSEWTPEKIRLVRSCYGAGSDIHAALDEIERLQARVGELSERLEITHLWHGVDGSDELVRVECAEPLPPHMDGISARDETIRLQDEQLDRARAERERCKQLLRECLPAVCYAAGTTCSGDNEKTFRDLAARIRAVLGEVRNVPV